MPRLTDISLKELASKKKVVGLKKSGTNVKVITKVFFNGNMWPFGIDSMIF